MKKDIEQIIIDNWVEIQKKEGYKIDLMLISIPLFEILKNTSAGLGILYLLDGTPAKFFGAQIKLIKEKTPYIGLACSKKNFLKIIDLTNATDIPNKKWKNKGK